MICYICEKRIEIEKEEYTFFASPMMAHGDNIHRRIYDDNRIRTGFHMECLKDSLSEDFGLFFEEIFE